MKALQPGLEEVVGFLRTLLEGAEELQWVIVKRKIELAQVALVEVEMMVENCPSVKIQLLACLLQWPVPVH